MKAFDPAVPDRLDGRLLVAVGLLLGLILSMGPLLGAAVSVVQVLRTYSAAAAAGQAAPLPGQMRFPIRPVAIGFAAMVPGLCLLSVSVMGYTRRIKHRRRHVLD